MKVDLRRINQYLLEIKSRTNQLKELLEKSTNDEILSSIWIVKGIKYTIVEIAEAMANVIQHILSKEKGIPVKGYVEGVILAAEEKIISSVLAQKLKPFFDFRNAIIHRYWIISDEKLLQLLRKNLSDFEQFIEEIEIYLHDKR